MSVVKIKDLGTFTYNYKIDLNKKFNIISAVLFKSAKVRNFSRYIESLLKFGEIKYIANKSFIFRLYYDDSILDDEYIKKIYPLLNKNYQLVHYDCPAFKDQDGLHDGTFGTLIRFLPFHDFPENDSNICFIWDVDFEISKHEKHLDILLNIQKKYNLDLVYLFRIWYDPPHIINDNDKMIANILIRKKI